MSTEDQPIPTVRNCTNCAFAVEARMNATDIKTTLICRWGPPQMVPTFTPKGITINIMQPAVNENVLCHQHRLRSEIANANSSPQERPTN